MEDAKRPDIDREIFYNKLLTQMRKMTDLRVSKGAVDLFLDFLFGEFKDKMAYAEKHAIRDGMGTIQDKHIMDVYCLHWNVRELADNRVEFPAKVWDSFSLKEKQDMEKMLDKHGWRVVVA